MPRPLLAPFILLATALALIAGLWLLAAAPGVAETLALSPSQISEAPYSALTFILVHAGPAHAAVNVAVIFAAALYARRRHCLRPALGWALAATPVAAMAFCAVARLAHTSDASLTGASVPAFALAAFACVVSRRRRLAIGVAVLAVVDIFGPNAGGGLAHCAAAAVGMAGAHCTLAAKRRRLARRELAAKAARLKAQTSGFASLNADERDLLTSHNHSQ